MLATVIILFILSLAAEFAGLTLIVRQVLDYRRTLLAWRALSPHDSDEATFDQMDNLGQVIQKLLGGRGSGVAGAVLVGAGILAGAAGNFLSLAL